MVRDKWPVLSRVQFNFISSPNLPSSSGKNATRQRRRSVCRYCLSTASSPFLRVCSAVGRQHESSSPPETHPHMHDTRSIEASPIHRHSHMVHASQSHLVHAF